MCQDDAQEHSRKQHTIIAAKIKELIQRILHHPDFNADEVEHDIHERLIKAVEGGDVEVLDLWEKDRENSAQRDEL